MTDRIYRRYDHRLRNMIVASGDPNLFLELNIPKSTVREWLKNGFVDVVTTASLSNNQSTLALKVARYEKEISQLKAEKTLYTNTVKICGFTIQYKRFPSEQLKKDILLLVQQAIKFLPLARCLELIDLS